MCSNGSNVHLIYENKLEFSESTYDISQQAFICNSILQHLVWIEFHNGKFSLAGVSGSPFMSQNSMYLVYLGMPDIHRFAAGHVVKSHCLMEKLGIRVVLRHTRKI